ncbi:MAG: tRNA preQ1(34) S-adenosylmethionine ribosyltransferase-isomerase QueA [Patescibacteria group bacterium]
MNFEKFNYNLPKELIAQKPVTPRDGSKLLIYSKKEDRVLHKHMYNLPKYLDSNDVLVFNNSKVFPARLNVYKPTGGEIEIFLLQDLGKGKWECLIGGKLKDVKELNKGNLKVNVLDKLENGNWLVKFNLFDEKFKAFLDKYAETPLPPYIKTKDSKSIRKKYQTIYAKHQGSVAAPTAGLHFTKKLLNQLDKKSVQMEFVTLHVGLGTFAPVKTNKIEDHKIHKEFGILDKKTCDRLNEAKKQGKRIIAVGTTSIRVLEGASKRNKLKPFSGWIDIFIYPGYSFKFIDAMITNFHLPKSSLLMLISAFINIDKVMEIYQKAIKKKYRFYSFGDALFIK